MRWELTIRNSNGSHFSQDEGGLTKTYVIALIALVAFIGFNATKLGKFYRAEGGLDYPVFVLFCAIFAEMLSVIFELLQISTYEQNGKGFFLFDFSNQALSILSQFIMTCLILLIAYGWSIHFDDFEDSDIVLPVGILVGLLHLVVVGLS